MQYSIQSRTLGRKLTFSKPGGYYIFCDNGERGKEGTLGYQICKEGRLNAGSTIGHKGDDQGDFERLCLNWYRQFLKRGYYR